MGGGGVSEDSNTNQSLPSSPSKNEKESTTESAKTTPKDEDDEAKEIPQEPGTPMETTNEVEESLTPPLLPNMKVKSPSDEKEMEKENKLKRVNWDMFAEQDIFKADTSVSKIL